MNTFFLSKIETILNGYLKLDPEILDRLKSLDGKSIQIIIIDWNIQTELTFESGKIHLNEPQESQSDAIIKGRLGSLLKAMISQTSFHSPEIQITGKIEIVEKFYKIIKSLDIDWEEYLSRFTGDTIAHHFGNATRKLSDWIKHGTDQLKGSFSEYVHEEARYLPTEHEIADFYHNISALRNDVERAEQRIDRLLNQTPPPEEH